MTALLHPDRASAVALLSVPYIPLGGVSFIEMMKVGYQDRFFYQVYFQNEGVVEAELEQDVRTSLRKIYFALSGGAPLNHWLAPKPKDAQLLDGLVDPQPVPDWMSERDLEVSVPLRGPRFSSLEPLVRARSSTKKQRVCCH